MEIKSCKISIESFLSRMKCHRLFNKKHGAVEVVPMFSPATSRFFGSMKIASKETVEIEHASPVSDHSTFANAIREFQGPKSHRTSSPSFCLSASTVVLIHKTKPAQLCLVFLGSNACQWALRCLSSLGDLDVNILKSTQSIRPFHQNLYAQVLHVCLP